MGYSRDTFYRYRQAVEEGGGEALIEKSRRTPNIRNRVAPAIEETVVTLAIDQPALGQVRVSNELRRRGDQISPPGSAACGSGTTSRRSRSASRPWRKRWPKRV